jgi:hypothetical protein
MRSITSLNCKILDLRFQAVPDEITPCHSSLGGEFGEGIDVVKDAIFACAGGSRCEHPGQDRGRLADKCSPFIARRNWTVTDGSKPDFWILDRLRTMVMTGNAEPIEFYPITLIQLSTRGFQHNFTASAEVKTNPGFGKIPDRTIPHFRFYFDGLIAHIHREPAGQLDDTIIGARPKLLVTTVAFEGSRQLGNLMTAKSAAVRKSLIFICCSMVDDFRPLAGM